MRVVLLTIGSRGDVQPFVVLGAELRERGHEAVLVSGADFKGMAEQAGIGFQALDTIGTDHATSVLTDPKVRAALLKGPSLYRMAAAAPRPSRADRQALTDEMVAAAEGADMIVNTTLTRIGALTKPTVPWCSVASWPITGTAAWPALGMPALPLGGGYNRLTHRATGALEWLLYRPEVNAGRTAAGVPPLGLRSPFRDDGVLRPILYQFSPHVFAPPADWPARCHVTGYWSDDVRWDQPAELTDFVEGGPPPLVAAFGSAWLVGGRRLLDASVAAAVETGRRLVVVGGPVDGLPDHVDAIRTEGADFTWLLPRAAAVLHHGGQGTTAAVVSAGVPQVIVPTYADQPVWAARMAALGVAAPPVAYSRLTAGALAAAVRAAVDDPSVAARAAALATAVRGDRGVREAADVIEAYAATAR
ncbi:glycosyltransferase [Umezawaea tangerina]|uniref:O-mycaminosyltylonolide 6-deoxyallosyltransferase n=1 Tax=Umezawaea tangerina TaxID=84725 RepID=A0A2T0SGG5_9PSEU|nr:nucleotide disphospho-sugar-binding domain-containing protein [Umezawaea tangerina]PRY32497.1 O-mycaminosyltylonolide 6-deoxyallosyltransferase [Umezawaea tangerina]